MITLAVFVLIALVLQADPAVVAEQLREADLMLLAGVVVMYLLNALTKVIRWYVLLSRKDESLSFVKVALYFLIGLAINNATPGRVTGEPVRAYLVKTGTDYPMGRGMASIFVEKTIDTIVTLTFALVGIILLLGVLNKEASDDLLLSAGIVAIFMMTLIVFIAFPGIPRRLAAMFFGRMRRKGDTKRAEQWEVRMDGFLGTFEEGTREIAKNPYQTAAATGLTSIIWFNEALRLWLIFLALGYNASFELMMVATALASFAALLIPLGAGSSTAIAAICTVAGIDGPLSTTSGLVFVMTSIWISIPLGAAAMAISGVKGDEMLGKDPSKGQLTISPGNQDEQVGSPPSEGRVAPVPDAGPKSDPSVLHVPDGDGHEDRPDPLLLNQQD
jgi:uncharacterized protein (TIRG00374 family)